MEEKEKRNGRGSNFERATQACMRGGTEREREREAKFVLLYTPFPQTHTQHSILIMITLFDSPCKKKRHSWILQLTVRDLVPRLRLRVMVSYCYVTAAAVALEVS